MQTTWNGHTEHVSCSHCVRFYGFYWVVQVMERRRWCRQVVYFVSCVAHASTNTR